MAARISSTIYYYADLFKTGGQGIFLSFIESTLGSIFYFFPLYFTRELHFTMDKVGLMTSFYGAGAILGGLVGGRLSDKISPVNILIMSLLTQAFMFLGLAKLKSIEMIMTDLFFLGMATYSFITANYVWVLAQCREQEAERFKMVSILSVISNLGMALAAILVSELTLYGFNTIFLIASILLFVLAVYLIFYQKNSMNNELCTEKNIHEKMAEISCHSLSGKILLVLGCVFFAGLVVSQLGATYPIYIQEKFSELGAKGVGLLFSINSLLVIVFQLPLINFFQDSNKLLLVGTSAFLMGVGMALLSVSFVFAAAIIACVIYTIGEMVFFSTAEFICYQSAHAAKKGRNLGFYRMTFAFSRVAGPLLGGFVYSLKGGEVVWYLCGVIGSFCLVSCFLWEMYSRASFVGRMGKLSL